MDIYKALSEARTLMNAHGLTDRGWTLKVDRAKARAGRCNYSTRTISLSATLIRIRDESAVHNTILHEIAHALTPGHHHDAVWRRQHVALGGNGQRCTDGTTAPARYIGTCPKGHTSKRHRFSKAIKLGTSCGVCNPARFDERYRLVWVDTQGSRV